MKLINEQFDLDRFWQEVGAADSPVLLTDYDGTLAPFVVDRNRAIVYPGVRDRLQKIIDSTRTRLVVISGRSVRDLIPLLQLEHSPEIWGCHGAERHFPDGRHHEMPLSPLVREALEAATQWAEAEGLLARTERKPCSLAFHWRGLNPAHAEQIAGKISERWKAQAAEAGLSLLEFDGGLELRVAGIDKGSAVRDISEELESSVPVAYLGDDYTDEDAMAAMSSTQLKVLVRHELRQTHADVHLVPPDELLAFLDQWINAVR